MRKVFDVIAVTIASLLVCVAACERLAAAEIPAAPLVGLENPAPTPHPAKQVLAREIVRQAFLIAAREDFRARTRDAALREPVPADAAARFRLDLELNEGQPIGIKLFRLPLTAETPPADTAPDAEAKPDDTKTPAGSASSEPAWSETVPVGPEGAVLAALGKVSGWTESPFATALRQAKLEPRKVDETVAADAAEESEEAPPLEFTALVASLRRRHAALAKEPGSVAILASIARDYALLGSVSEIHWGSAHKVFKARSLIYAERAVAAGPKEAGAAWSRALARMLAGLHQPAAEEIARARGLGEAGTPPWSAGLESFSRWDQEALALEAQDDAPLARYFAMLHAEFVGTLDQRMAADRALLETHPECFRGIAALAAENPLGVRRSVGGAQLRQLAVSLPGLLALLDGWPEEFSKELASRGGGDGTRVDVLTLGELLTKLRAVDAAADRQEPSFAAVATLAEDLTFVQANQIVTTQAGWLAVDAGQAIEQMQAILGPHPYKRFLEVYQRDSDIGRKVFEEVAKDLLALPLSEAAMKQTRFQFLAGPQSVRMSDSPREQRDMIAPDILAILADSFSDAEKAKYLPALRRMSPDCPAVIAAAVQYDWNSAAPQAAALVESTGSAQVLRALAAKYEKLEEEDGANAALAERCFTRLAEVDNSFESANSLASYLWRHKNYARWKEVTIASLELPSYGLEDAMACTRLADYMMNQGEWTEAEPYALRAAESYATAGLQSAGRCMEGEGRWEEAEKFYRAKSERYESFWADWYFFCKRTGEGDLAAASEYCQRQLAELPKDDQRRQLAAIYHQLEGNLQGALGILSTYHRTKDEGTYSRLSSVMILDELKRTKDRDGLATFLANESPYQSESMLADLVLRPGREAAPPTEGELELVYLLSGAENRPTNTAYFIGRLLLNQGATERAIPWLQRAATSPRRHAWACTLAAAALRENKATVGEIRKSDWGDEFAEVAGRVTAVLDLYNPQHMAEARKRVGEAAEAHPKSAAVWLLSGNIARDMGDREEAAASYGKALEIVPGHPLVLATRGKVLELLGREKEAIADYEGSLKVAPYYQGSHNALAWIRAASLDDGSRDAKAAQEHAKAMMKLGPDEMGIGPVALAAGYAEGGEFDRAAKMIEQAINQKRYPDQERLKTFLELYRAKKPYRRSLAVPMK